MIRENKTVLFSAHNTGLEKNPVPIRICTPTTVTHTNKSAINNFKSIAGFSIQWLIALIFFVLMLNPPKMLIKTLIP
jgi:hypothetical protein